MTEPIPLRAPRADLGDLTEQIINLVYALKDRISVAEAVGCLEVAKHEILRSETS